MGDDELLVLAGQDGEYGAEVEAAQEVAAGGSVDVGRRRVWPNRR